MGGGVLNAWGDRAHHIVPLKRVLERLYPGKDSGSQFRLPSKFEIDSRYFVFDELHEKFIKHKLLAIWSAMCAFSIIFHQG